MKFQLAYHKYLYVRNFSSVELIEQKNIFVYAKIHQI